MESVEAFWQWFVEHEDDLLHWERDRERIFDELHDELKKVHPNLSFEFGPPQPQREFIISAGGIKDAFPTVVALRRGAPPFPNWEIIAFRPRRSGGSVIELDGVRVDSKGMQFTLLDNEKTAALEIYIPGFRDDEPAFAQIGYLFLDQTLGEFDAVTGLAFVDMFPSNKAQNGTRYPFDMLPSKFDNLTALLEGHTSKPH